MGSIISGKTDLGKRVSASARAVRAVVRTSSDVRPDPEISKVTAGVWNIRRQYIRADPKAG
jgi:hypothetical protein